MENEFRGLLNARGISPVLFGRGETVRTFRDAGNASGSNGGFLSVLQENISTPEPADISEDDHYPSKHRTFHYLHLSFSLSSFFFLPLLISHHDADLAVPFLAGVEGGRTFTRLRITRS